MKVVSVNVGLPREVGWRGKVVTTSIFKSPVTGRAQVNELNIEGDLQSDLSVHGGMDKAVYVYPSEHYAYWRKELPGISLTWGAFGENLTTEGLLENAVRIGDGLRVGTASFVVTQPRMPCFKLGIRFDRPDLVRLFLHSGRTGFYLRVAEAGGVAANDEVSFTSRNQAALSVSDITMLYTARVPARDLLQRASNLEALPESWRAHFRERLSAQSG